MELTLKQLNNINHALSGVFRQQLNGLLSYKLFKIKKSVEITLQPLFEVVNRPEVTDEEIQQILEQSENIEIEYIEENELMTMNISMEDILFLDPIIRKEQSDEIVQNA